MKRLLPALVCLSACAAPQLPPPTIDPALAAAPWSFETAAPVLRAASCPEGASFIKAETIEINATPIELGPSSAVAERLSGLTYAGGWHLTSPDPNFGGLSGLETFASGNLLTVSDAGAFIWISMEDGAPSGSGNIAYMRGAGGEMLSGKTSGDAEGLVLQDGLALVSFERDHRILAFDLEGCGAGAKGALVAELPKDIANKRFEPNRGAEALSLSSAGALTFGYETGPGGARPTGSLYGNGDPIFGDLVDGPGGYAYVGRDEAGGETAHLFRSYDALRGNRNILDYGAARAEIMRPLAADNYEGVAIQSLPGGRERIWIISDDNFNPRQRTLLLAFDVVGG